MPEQISSIAANLARVRERIARAARTCRAPRGRNHARRRVENISSGGDSRGLRSGPARLRRKSRAGIRVEARRSSQISDATWHLIGHLQSNKAQRAVHLFDRVDSVDSLALAQKLDSGGDDQEKRLPVLIEVHLGGEATKSGVTEADLPALAEAVSTLAHLDLRGLMTIPPYSDDAERVAPLFPQAARAARRS